MFYYICITIICSILIILEAVYLTFNIIQLSCFIGLTIFIGINLIITSLPHTKMYNAYYMKSRRMFYGLFVLLILYSICIAILIITAVITSTNMYDLRHLYLICYALSLLCNDIVLFNLITKIEPDTSIFGVIQLQPMGSLIIHVTSKDTMDLLKQLHCTICHEQFINPITKVWNKPISRASSDCQHYFHTECIQTWHNVALNCPLCRTIPSPTMYV